MEIKKKEEEELRNQKKKDMGMVALEGTSKKRTKKKL